MDASNEKAKFIGVGKGVNGEVGGELFGEWNGVVNFFGGFFDGVGTAGVVLDFDSDSTVLHLLVFLIDEEDLG